MVKANFNGLSISTYTPHEIDHAITQEQWTRIVHKHRVIKWSAFLMVLAFSALATFLTFLFFILVWPCFQRFATNWFTDRWFNHESGSLNALWFDNRRVIYGEFGGISINTDVILTKTLVTPSATAVIAEAKVIHDLESQTQIIQELKSPVPPRELLVVVKC